MVVLRLVVLRLCAEASPESCCRGMQILRLPRAWLPMAEPSPAFSCTAPPASGTTPLARG